ncbi:hypothetical protein [Paenibacillus ginsengarvi]|uniref:Uncharacterized protein n=1 Tax=Paenibacillus ginsengarvi TaxID=400777 RepID=A0A3B0BNV4_9BACL|nr:hypothetical protein [Paenibacillus ginsengarvi]RKN75045.1 hypothetical protein D7M11_26290 [Paenibacillus ginsengarvi]
MNGIAKLLNLTTAIDRKAPYIVSVWAQSGCGVDVSICKRISEAGAITAVQKFWEVDRHPDQLASALKAVEAVANGTFVEGGDDLGGCRAAAGI